MAPLGHILSRAARANEDMGNDIMRKFLFTWLACLVCVPGAAIAGAVQQAPLLRAVTTQVDGHIVIDSEGRPIEYQIQTPLPEGLGPMLDRTVRQWRFHPVLVDGVPREVGARVRVTLAAIKDGSDIRIVIDNVLFPGNESGPGLSDVSAFRIPAATDKTLGAPHYPENLLRSDGGGRVLLAIQVNPDGSVAQAVAVQAALTGVRGKATILADIVAQLEETTISAAKNWRFQVTAAAQRTPEGLTIMDVVTFQPEDVVAAKPGQWRTEFRAAHRDIPWLQADAARQKIGVSDMGDNEALPLNDAMALDSEVIGTALSP